MPQPPQGAEVSPDTKQTSVPLLAPPPPPPLSRVCGVTTQPGSGRSAVCTPALSSYGAHGESDKFKALCFRKGFGGLTHPCEAPLVFCALPDTGGGGVPRGQEGGGQGWGTLAGAVRGAAQRAVPSNAGILLAPVKLLPQILIHVKGRIGGLGVKKGAKDAGYPEAAQNRGAPPRSGRPEIRDQTYLHLLSSQQSTSAFSLTFPSPSPSSSLF